MDKKRRSILIPINDGYTKTGTFPDGRGGYPAVNFTYRPALPEAVYDYLEAPKLTGKDRFRATIAMLKAHLRSWDVFDDDGDAVAPMTDEIFKRTPQRILEYILQKITGWGEDEQEEDAKN
jgi:hypothetical protein